MGYESHYKYFISIAFFGFGLCGKRTFFGVGMSKLVEFRSIGKEELITVTSEFKEMMIGWIVVDYAGFYGFVSVGDIVLNCSELRKISEKISVLNKHLK